MSFSWLHAWNCCFFHSVEQVVKQFLILHSRVASVGQHNGFGFFPQLDWTCVSKHGRFLWITTLERITFQDSRSIDQGELWTGLSALTDWFLRGSHRIRMLRFTLWRVRSMTAGDVAATQGGNYQIFEVFICTSNAWVYLNTTLSPSLFRTSRSWKNGLLQTKSLMLDAYSDPTTASGISTIKDSALQLNSSNGACSISFQHITSGAVGPT